jgi:hypothetical protein
MVDQMKTVGDRNRLQHDLMTEYVGSLYYGGGH